MKQTGDWKERHAVKWGLQINMSELQKIYFSWFFSLTTWATPVRSLESEFFLLGFFFFFFYFLTFFVIESKKEVYSTSKF